MVSTSFVLQKVVLTKLLDKSQISPCIILKWALLHYNSRQGRKVRKESRKFANRYGGKCSCLANFQLDKSVLILNPLRSLKRAQKASSSLLECEIRVWNLGKREKRKEPPLIFHDVSPSRLRERYKRRKDATRGTTWKSLEEKFLWCGSKHA